MENGAQGRFLERFQVFPLYYQTISDKFNYLKDTECGTSNPNQITNNKDQLMKSNQNFNIVSYQNALGGQKQMNTINYDQGHEMMSPVKAHHDHLHEGNSQNRASH